MRNYIIIDWVNNHCFTNKKFKSYEDAWDFLYNTFPVIVLPDGTRDDQEAELDSYFVIKSN
jgi:hypothetical protein